MTDEEKLKEYLQDNTPKRKKLAVSKPFEPDAVKIKPNKTATAWYRGNVISDVLGVMLFATFFPAVALGIMENNGVLNVDEAWTLGIIIIGSIFVFTVGLSVYKYMRYTAWMNNKYYKVSGWKEFFEKRTPDFWDERNYTNVRINFNLSPAATDLHREALKAFTAKIIHKWDKEYQDKDLEWIGSIPKDLQSNGTSIYGDISKRELLWFLKIMVPKFMPLSRLLKDNLKEVTISSGSKESTHEMKEEKEDVYDRADSWTRRHSD
jgi:hypothetical protein